MAIETLHAVNYIAGTVSSPNNALDAPDGIFTTDTGNTDWTGRWGMGVPPGNLSGTQNIIVRYRKDSAGGGTPSLSIFLYENGIQVRGIVASTDALSEDTTTVTGAFSSIEITDIQNVEIEIVAVGNGGGPNGRSIQVDAITWAANVQEPAQIYSDSISLNHSLNISSNALRSFLVSTLLNTSLESPVSSSTDYRQVYINTTPDDIGRQIHPIVSWSDLSLELGPINKSSLSGNIFYFKARNNLLEESNWYGPILIGEVYTELVNLLTSTSISNISQVIPPSQTIVNALLNINYHLDFITQGTELGTALVALSKNMSLDVETRAVINAVMALLKNNIISVEQFGSVLNVIVSLDKNYTLTNSFFEPPQEHKVKFIRLRIKS